MDPLHIFAFSVAHVVMSVVAVGFVLPRALDVFVPLEKRHDGSSTYAPQITVLGIYSGDAVVENGGEELRSEPASLTRKS